MTTYEAVVLDVDGTIVRGERLLPGAVSVLEDLDSVGCRRLLFSNNPTRRPAYYCERLANHGVSVDPSSVLTSATVSAAYLATEHPNDRVFVVGEDRLRAILREAGVSLTSDPERADVVLGSIDRTVTYEDLADAVRTLESGVPYYGTDPDVSIPTAGGAIPGSGSILAAISAAAGREPDAVLGKPSETAAAAATDLLGVDPAEVLVVGDRLDTDVALGTRAGMDTALVLTGVTARQDVESSAIQPDHVFESVGEVSSVL